jgi:hypothetical protein
MLAWERCNLYEEALGADWPLEGAGAADEPDKDRHGNKREVDAAAYNHDTVILGLPQDPAAYESRLHTTMLDCNVRTSQAPCRPKTYQGSI